MGIVVSDIAVDVAVPCKDEELFAVIDDVVIEVGAVDVSATVSCSMTSCTHLAQLSCVISWVFRRDLSSQ